MKRIYIAGRLSADAVKYIQNVHMMSKYARCVRNMGFAVYTPSNDFLEGAIDGAFEYEDYFENSQSWLDVSDALFVCPGWETSSGTIREIERAKNQNIPVFYDLDKMKEYFDNKCWMVF